MAPNGQETLVAEAVLDLATRTYQCEVQDLLHDLTTHAVTLLDIRAAGATIPNGPGRAAHLAASDETCRQLEEDQLELGEGPCVDSARSGAVLTPVSLGPSGPGRLRWPRFTPRALRAGITSVAAVPLRADGNPIGTLSMMSAAPVTPPERNLRTAQVLADAAGAWLLKREVLRAKDKTLEQLQTALRTRIVIEQAKGVLAARMGIPVEEAFVRIRTHARSRQEKLSELAARVVRGGAPDNLDEAS